ncbi:MAG TPA: hypothetical protein VKE50_05095 [Thermoanaerobaculia bacterium]|nr:hypothetical protein [Thermoanaerobaculia bacterium]
MRTLNALFAGILLAAIAASGSAQTVDPARFADLRWRLVGPFRGGWATCAEGVPGSPNTFYFGAAAGGVWKTEDAGQTWVPLFDRASSASIGALAVAPSNPAVIYAGTGQTEARYDLAAGDGLYRSDDGGGTWRRVGLEATRHIGRILVDPHNTDIVLVAALGHYYGPNRERGVFRSEDGGRSWKQTLFVNEDTGAVDLAWDRGDPSVVYAALWQARNFPWLSYFQPVAGPGSGIFKSSDGGRTWKQLTGGGWPAGDLGRIGLAVAPRGRVYALVDAPAPAGPSRRSRRSSGGGLYRSDDGGTSWTLVHQEEGFASSYFGRVTADPRNPDVVYVMGQSIRRSEDGGKTFRFFKGAPGGDDYHFLWIDAEHADHMVTASDQGTVITVNGGKTWSDWYNQPTGQFYHAATDDRFPYWIYSGQQDSGTAGIASRGDYGAVTYREWNPVGGEERGWDVPDPADPNLIYGTGLGGTVTRFDSRTGQVANISPAIESTYGRRPTEVLDRFTWITPIAVSARPPHALYFGSQRLFRSTDRGQSWTIVSPDLTGAVPGASGCEGAVTLASTTPCGFGVIFVITLSQREEGEIWVGTDNGMVWLTRDGGGRWQNVTPPALAPWSKIASLDLSPLDPGTAYVAADRHRTDDFAPYAYRTHDYGKTWTPITAGLPSEQFVTVVRADPVRRGLLYAGTSAGVFVSFDDGGRWQPLQGNLPTAWVGDLTVHGADLIAATQGRAIWILDDVSPLRAAADRSQAAPYLVRPAAATRVRANENRDTPLPPETPEGKNPPAGAIIDYVLSAPAQGGVKIEILDAQGGVVRAYSSSDSPEKLDARRYFTEGWIRPAPLPPPTAGHHRIVWDLRSRRPRAPSYEYSIAAVWGEDTPIVPQGVLALPGRYTVRLIVGGKQLTQPLELRMDPRVTVPEQDLVRQFDLASRLSGDLDRASDALEQVHALRAKLAEARKNAAVTVPADLDARAAGIAEGQGKASERDESLSRVAERLASVYNAVESADTAPSAQEVATAGQLESLLERRLAEWTQLSRQAAAR